jgi:hypothetical protein
MSRVIAVTACGFTLAACSMSMPSMDLFKSTPPTETLRIESEPPGADARTTQGQSCRTPCELTVPSGAEVSVSFALNGYQPVTVPVRPEAPAGATYGEQQGAARLQPNPVYAELQATVPPRPLRKKRSAPAAKRPAAAKTAAPANAAPAAATATSGAAPAASPAPAPAPTQSQATAPAGSTPTYGAGYPWPPPPQ